MIALNAILIVLAMVSFLCALLWTIHRWRSRGGLQVQFFHDRLSKNVSGYALFIFTVSVFSLIIINLFLLVGGTEASSSYLSGIGLFVVAPLIVTQADVEGRYGSGIFVRQNSKLVMLKSVEFSVLNDRIIFKSNHGVDDRYFHATRSNRKHLRMF